MSRTPLAAITGNHLHDSEPTAYQTGKIVGAQLYKHTPVAIGKV